MKRLFTSLTFLTVITAAGTVATFVAVIRHTTETSGPATVRTPSGTYECEWVRRSIADLSCFDKSGERILLAKSVEIEEFTPRK